jgi:integrase
MPDSSIRASSPGTTGWYVADPGAQEALEAWLEFRGAEAGPLFCPISQTGEITVRRMTDQALYNALRKWQAQAGVQRLSPHDFRRTGITHLLGGRRRHLSRAAARGARLREHDDPL